MNWRKVKISDFLKERVGRYKPNEANSMNLKRVEKIDFSGMYHLVSKPTNTDMILVKRGDLLISGINAEKGAVTIYYEVEDALATIHYSSYEFDKSRINIEYFKWFLISDAFRKLLKQSASGGIKTELKSKHLLPLEISLPPLNKQGEIVQRIKLKYSVFKKIENQTFVQQSHLQLLRQTILQEAVQGKLTQQNPAEEPASELLKRIKAKKQKLIKEGKLKKEKELPPLIEQETPFALPEGWVWCRLGEVIDLRSGVTLGKSYKDELIEIPYLRVANVQRGFIDTSHLKTIRVPKSEIEKYSLAPNDLCMIEGGDWDKVGRCSIWKGEAEPCIHQNHIFRLRFFELISVEWSEMFLNSPNARRYFESCSKQTTNLASINRTQLQNLIFPLPPFAEQLRIVFKVQKLQKQLNNLEAQVEQSRSHAEQLLQKVLQDTFADKVQVYEMNEEMTIAPEN